MSGFWRISVLIYVVTSASAQQNAGNLYCPMTWSEGQQVTLEFHIDESLFPVQCTTTDNEPFFQRSSTSTGTPTILCRTADITTSNACTTSFPAGSPGCGCIARNGSYVLQYNFVADTSHNGWWSASVQCADAFANQMLTFTATQCDNITVQGKNTKDTGDWSTEEKVGIGVGVFIAALICAGVVTTIVVHKKKIYVFFIIAEEKVPYLKQKIKDMKGVSIRPTTNREKKKYKGPNYVIEISKDQKRIRTQLEKIIKDWGGELPPGFNLETTTPPA